MNAKWPFILVLIHWASAAVVVGMFASGLWMVDLNYYSDWYNTAPHWHKSVGIILLVVTLMRLILRTTTSRPTSFGSPVEKRLSHVGHAALYILLFSLFISGYLISTADGRSIDVFNWLSVPALGKIIENQADLAGDIHFYIAWSLIGLAVLHALAALKHHVINKDDTLKQMLRLR